jgi:uncharacterized protein YfaS (alpha-2-macroglobulin family)
MKLDIIPNRVVKPRDRLLTHDHGAERDETSREDAEVSLGIVDEAIYSTFKARLPATSARFLWQALQRSANHARVHYVYHAAAKARTWLKTNRAINSPTLRPKARSLNHRAQEFKDTAFWQLVVTGGDGKADVTFSLPDNLTKWRATAALSPRTRVSVRQCKNDCAQRRHHAPGVPRFLTEGDTVTISGVVHNCEERQS